MHNHEIGIKKFIRTPWAAVRSGYRPGYLDCVACCADTGSKLLLSASRDHFSMLRDFWDMTVGEVFHWLLWTPVVIATVIMWPALIWVGGAVMLEKIKKEVENVK